MSLRAAARPLVAGVGLAVCVEGWPPPQASPAPATEQRALEPSEQKVRLVCSRCHAFPPPEILPRSAWGPTMYSMAGLMMSDIGLPPGARRNWDPTDFDVEAFQRFYESRAPREVPPPEPWPAPEPAGRFVRRPVRPQALARPYFTANVRLLDVEGDARLEWLASDMRHGLVIAGRPYEPSAEPHVLARVPHPSRATQADLDRDGRADLLIADLGAFEPGDQEKGSVVWLRRQPDDTYDAVVLAAGLPRVADVQAADLDADSDLDLVVAGFGWRTSGSVLLLENRTRDAATPEFSPRVLDARVGAVQGIPLDVDKDARTDVVTLLAQHHESVVALLKARGGWSARELHQAPHPNWGYSGMHAVDLDRDGDVDLVLANGDTLDGGKPMPYHGVSWLENQGGLRFTERRLAGLGGALCVQAGDLDGDGDLDVAAGALVDRKDVPEAGLPALVWLEQTARGRFERHTLSAGVPRHATLDLGDYDRDGDLDLVVGCFPESPASDTLLELWENTSAERRTPRPAPTR